VDRLEAGETRLDASSCSRVKLLVGKRAWLKFRGVTDIVVAFDRSTEKIEANLVGKAESAGVSGTLFLLVGRFEISQFRQRDARQFHNSRKEQPEN